MSSKPDRYARVEYRRLIAWEKRIEREGPFLEQVFGAAPERSVLDLGCGTGEHVAFFAGKGYRAVGLDGSESMIEKAREHEACTFVHGDMLEAAEILREEIPFGGALCLGNVLPHFLEEEMLERLMRGLGSVLVPGGVFLTQLLNYRRILDRGLRHLPLNFREGNDGEEVIFLRLMRQEPDGGIIFYPTTLALDPDAEEPVSVKASRRVPLRPWVAADLVPRFEASGFAVRVFGDMEGGVFDPAESTDLVVVATRE